MKSEEEYFALGSKIIGFKIESTYLRLESNKIP